MSQSYVGNGSGGGGGTSITTIDTDLLGPVTPTAGVVTISGGSTGLQTTGTGSTLDLTGTLDVANGGTGDTSFTAYSVICGGTTSTGALQNVSGVGTSGQVLTSGGSGHLPTWQTAGGISADPFLVYLSSTQSNVTGDNTTYQVPFDTVVFDVGSNFTTGASAHFTAPATGKYFFQCQTFISNGGTTTAVQADLILVATLRSLDNQTGNAIGGGNVPFQVSGVLDMTSGDTLHVTFNLNNFLASKNVTVFGGGSPYWTWISGYRVA